MVAIYSSIVVLCTGCLVDFREIAERLCMGRSAKFVVAFRCHAFMML